MGINIRLPEIFSGSAGSFQSTGRALVWLLSALLGLSALSAQAQTFPPLAGHRVVDAANIIPDADEPALEAKLKALEDSTGRQVVIATIPDLQGYGLDDYGYKLGRAWGIGEKGKNNGLVLFLAPNEPAGHRGPRIEVGYGLEPIITDALASVIANGIMTPRLRAGDMTGALNAGTDALISQLKLPPDQAIARAKQISAQNTKDSPDIGAVIFWLFIFLFFILPMIRGLFGRGGRGRRYGSGPVIIWGGGNDWGGGGGSSWGSGGGFGGGGGFSGGGGSFGGGGASGGW
ncbi:MAG: hypothetical protein RIS52_423 [Pseudomonadota bacterium]